MEEIRQKRGLAYSVHSSFAPLKEEGPFEIGLQTRKEQSEEALALTQRVLSDFVANGPTEKELTAAKQNIIGSFPLRIDSNKKIVGYLALIGFYKLPLTYLDDYLKAVGKVTVAEIKDAFQRRIDPKGMVIVVVGAVDQNPAVDRLGYGIRRGIGINETMVFTSRSYCRWVQLPDSG